MQLLGGRRQEQQPQERGTPPVAASTQAAQAPDRASQYRFVSFNELSDEARRYAEMKRQTLARTVPKFPIPERYYGWALMRGELPVGAYFASPYMMFGEGVVEAGLRVWQPSRGALEASRGWLAWLLTTNSRVIGRVFPNNKSVKNTIQALGFRLYAYDYDEDGRLCEVHVLERGQLMGPKPRRIAAR